MNTILVDLLSDSALDELKVMQNDRKIRILTTNDVHFRNEQRDQIWKELEEYTYETILKKVKEGISS